MSERLLKFKEVSERVGLGRTAIYARIKRGRFPEQCKLGSASRWVESEIEAWIEGFASTVPLNDPRLRRAMGLHLDD